MAQEPIRRRGFFVGRFNGSRQQFPFSRRGTHPSDKERRELMLQELNNRIRRDGAGAYSVRLQVQAIAAEQERRMNKMDTTERVWAFISAYAQDHSFSPSYREIQNALGLSSTANVDYHINKLAEQGVIIRGPSHTARTIKLITPWRNHE